MLAYIGRFLAAKYHEIGFGKVFLDEDQLRQVILMSQLVLAYSLVLNTVEVAVSHLVVALHNKWQFTRGHSPV